MMSESRSANGAGSCCPPSTQLFSQVSTAMVLPALTIYSARIWYVLLSSLLLAHRPHTIR